MLRQGLSNLVEILLGWEDGYGHCIKERIIADYRSLRLIVHASKEKSLENVHTQHRNYNNKHYPQMNKMPREEILLNLTKETQTWIRAGEHVILLIDCNEDVHSPNRQQFLQDSNL
jgi:hypothetical protein